MKRTLLHVHPGASTFVVKDRKLLSGNFTVIDLPFVWRAKWQVPFLLLKQFLHLCTSACKWQAIAVQFSGYHAVLPTLLARMLGRPCIIIAGGTDCVAFPSLRYGNFARQPLAWATRVAYRSATHIVPVHASLVRATNSYRDEDAGDQGILAYMPTLRTPITVVPNGYDAEAWHAGTGQRDIDVITVASGDRRPSTMRLKGLDMILELARARPALRFTIIGMEPDPRNPAPPNLTFIPPVPNDRLQGYYQRSKVYAQLSLSEGFPNALCEAMLCGCVPLVSAVGAMPDIIAGSGAVVRERSITDVAAALEELMKEIGPAQQVAARERIATNFTEGSRQRQLIDLIDTALADK